MKGYAVLYGRIDLTAKRIIKEYIFKLTMKWNHDNLNITSELGFEMRKADERGINRRKDKVFV